VQLPVVLKLLRGLRLTLGYRLENVQIVVRNFVPVFVSRGVVQISAYIDALLASLLPTGAVAALAYAQTLYTLPVSLFGMSVSAAELPVMSGALGNVPGTRNVVPGGIEAETKQTMENIGAVLKRQRTLIRRRVQMHGGTRRHRAMGDLQQGLCHLFQARPPAGAVRLRRQRSGARPAGRT